MPFYYTHKSNHPQRSLVYAYRFLCVQLYTGILFFSVKLAQTILTIVNVLTPLFGLNFQCAPNVCNCIHRTLLVYH